MEEKMIDETDNTEDSEKNRHSIWEVFINNVEESHSVLVRG
jgi:hypothetical protein